MSPTPDPRSDLERLVRHLLPLAKAALEETGSFAPFGGGLAGDGEIRPIDPALAESAGEDAFLEWVDAQLHLGARAGEFSATAAVSNVYVRRATGGPRDAIHLRLDHVAGASVELFFPYRIKRPGVATFGRAFSREGCSRVFGPGGRDPG